MSDFENDVMRSLGRIEQHLKDQNGRVDRLERKNEIDEWRDWIKIAVVLPVITAIHALLNKIGVRV
jgi:hypothetical protein